ncbi:hypothetical protein CEXT_712811 [Caerostris extrusa]|uniref:Uncharacterized protein n=1 Tax=Caerostris extrusa TaxID=172846 RepID=A0AAV4RT45_CAEEX|nr:hypothetical protein CEXT_712811 [Caerostris extrusa]
MFPSECSRAIKEVLSSNMARWHVLRARFQTSTTVCTTTSVWLRIINRKIAWTLMSAEDVLASAAQRLRGLLSFIMARWDVLPSSFPDVNYSVPDDFTELSTNECATYERIFRLPYFRRPSTPDTILKCHGNQDPWVRDAVEEKGRDNSIRAAHRNCFLLQTAETCPPTNAQRVKGSPIHLIAGDRPPSTQSLSASVIRIPGGQRRQRREEPR